MKEVGPKIGVEFRHEKYFIIFFSFVNKIKMIISQGVADFKSMNFHVSYNQLLIIYKVINHSAELHNSMECSHLSRVPHVNHALSRVLRHLSFQSSSQ